MKKEVIKSNMPDKIIPMLCTLTKAPITDPQYIFELKWDGYRIVSKVEKQPKDVVREVPTDL